MKSDVERLRNLLGSKFAPEHYDTTPKTDLRI